MTLKHGLFGLFCMALLGCSGEPGRLEKDHQRDRLHKQGLALVTDACVYRQNIGFMSNYYLIDASRKAALHIRDNLSGTLSARGFNIVAKEIPFVCGSLYSQPPGSTRIADDLKTATRKARDFPIVDLPLLRADAGLLDAYRQMMKVVAEVIEHAPKEHLYEHLKPQQSAALRQHFRTDQLLIVVGRGGSISTQQKTLDTVAGVLIGGEIGARGCSLVDPDCTLGDISRDQFRVWALLLDLSNPPLSEIAKSQDVVKHQYPFDDSDPLDEQLYDEAEWQVKLLKSLPAFN